MNKPDYEHMTMDELIQRVNNPSSFEEEWEAGKVLEQRCPLADSQDQ